jgi:AraC-like DNA-binding protein
LPAIAPGVVAAVTGVLRDLGVTAPLDDPDAMFDIAADALGEPMLGVVVAARVPVGAYGLLEYGMRASATVGEALERLAKHYAAVSERVRAELSTVDGFPAFVYVRRTGVRHSRHWIEMPAAVVAGRLREGVGNAPLLHEVRFTHAGPPGDRERERYREAFGARVVFEASTDALLFEHGATERTMWTGAEAIATSVDAALASYRSEAGSFTDPLRTRLRTSILRALPHGATLGGVARDMKLATRTLQRAISALGSSWSEELDEVRRERAMTLLGEPDRKTSDIATELGFYDTSSFFRAVRRWTGTTPSELRRRGTQ